MSIIQVAAATQAIADAEKALVEAFKPILRDAAYRALPGIKDEHGYDGGAYARQITKYLVNVLPQAYRVLGYSRAVVAQLDEFVTEDLDLEIHKSEFVHN